MKGSRMAAHMSLLCGRWAYEEPRKQASTEERLSREGTLLSPQTQQLTDDSATVVWGERAVPSPPNGGSPFPPYVFCRLQTVDPAVKALRPKTQYKLAQDGGPRSLFASGPLRLTAVPCKHRSFWPSGHRLETRDNRLPLHPMVKDSFGCSGCPGL